MSDSNDWPRNEIVLGPLANALYGIGRLEMGGLDAKGALSVAFMLGNAADSLSKWGFAATGGAFRNLAELIEAHSVRGREHLHGPEQIPVFITIARQTLMHELDARVFLTIDSPDAHFYRDPLRDWSETISRFPQTIDDIEEAGTCYALRRYPACVFHCMQMVEHGLLELGTFIGVADPKSGFTAVSNELRKIANTKYSELDDFQKAHYSFLEQMNASVQAIKDAWRNKVNHAQGRLVVMTADFSQAVALEIYMATRAFMRRLATDLPKEDRQWTPSRR